MILAYLAHFGKKHFLALKAQNTFTKISKNELKAFKVTHKVQLVELQEGLGVHEKFLWFRIAEKTFLDKEKSEKMQLLNPSF